MNRTVLGIVLLAIGSFLLVGILVAQGIAADTSSPRKNGVNFFSGVAGIVFLINTGMGYGCLNYAFKNKHIKD